jgi:ribosomal protein S6
MEKETRTGIYEIGYLLVPSITEENLGAEVTSFKDNLLKHNVTFISEEFPKMIELAYEMTRSISNKKQKFSYGYFGWVKFECSPKEADIIKNELEKDEKIIRFLLIKTVRESTMSPKKSFKQDSSRRRSVSKVQEVAPVINEEIIDKEIDALVS